MFRNDIKEDMKIMMEQAKSNIPESSAQSKEQVNEAMVLAYRKDVGRLAERVDLVINEPFDKEKRKKNLVRYTQ